MKSSRFGVLTIKLIIIALTACAAVFFAMNQFAVPTLGIDRVAWGEYAEKHSPDEIRKAFVAEGSNLSYNDAHALAHIVGEVLYKKIGPSGIVACGTEFEYGCYHGFAGRMLEEKGMDSINDVNEGCLASPGPLGCLHGVGHGILAFLGNDQLLQALKACDDLHQSSPIGGCFGGVFMEYNFNTMQSPSGVEVRQFAATQAFEPCASLRSELQRPCYFDQPAWWHAAALPNGSEAERFERDGELCSGVRGKVNRDTCYQGIGNVVAPTSGLSQPIMREWCGTMPDQNAEMECLEYAQLHGDM